MRCHISNFYSMVFVYLGLYFHTLLTRRHNTLLHNTDNQFKPVVSFWMTQHGTGQHIRLGGGLDNRLKRSVPESWYFPFSILSSCILCWIVNQTATSVHPNTKHCQRVFWTFRNSLFEKSLRFAFIVIVDQLQVHVDEERVKELRQLGPVAVQHRLDELLQPAVVHLIQRRIPLLAVRREDNADIRLVLSTCS